MWQKRSPGNDPIISEFNGNIKLGALVPGSLEVSLFAKLTLLYMNLVIMIYI